MAQHDPVNFASGLSARLAARSRHVCVFLGAGASKACGLPDVSELQKKVIASLPNEEGASFQKLLANRGLEQALSRIRRISSLVENADTVDGLTREAANKLDQLVCREIIKNLVIPAEDSAPMSLLAAWLRRANYVLPVEVFTVNYDLLIEGALDQLKVPYFDGFIGTIRASFQTEMAEALSPNDRDWLPAYFVRLWKLHGSVNWEWDKKNVVRLGRAVDSGVPAAIYPSDTKYDESRRVPFLVLQDRLRRSLHLPETILLVSGYSFGDDHLNELISVIGTAKASLTRALFSISPFRSALTRCTLGAAAQTRGAARPAASDSPMARSHAIELFIRSPSESTFELVRDQQNPDFLRR